MAKKDPAPWAPAKAAGLARQFRLLGFTGFWIQLVLFAASLFLLVFVLVKESPEAAARRGFELRHYVSIASLLVMLFTTAWCYRYTRLAQRIADPEKRPPPAMLMRTLWIGIGACALGIVVSVAGTVRASLRMLFTLLATPQTGVPVVSPMGGDPGKTVSAIDALTLSALQLALAAELTVLALSLWLLFRVTRSSPVAAGSTGAAPAGLPELDPR